MTATDLILNVLSFLMLIVLAWFSFTILNIIVTIYKVKKKDNSFQFCLSSKGKIFYIVFTIIFVAVYIGGVVAIINAMSNNGDISIYRIALNVMALFSLFYSMAISNMIQLGKKEMMVGRMLIDYRKMKKVTFGLDDKITFVFAQKEYNVTTRFADVSEIRRALKR